MCSDHFSLKFNILLYMGYSGGVHSCGLHVVRHSVFIPHLFVYAREFWLGLNGPLKSETCSSWKFKVCSALLNALCWGDIQEIIKCRHVMDRATAPPVLTVCWEVQISWNGDSTEYVHIEILNALITQAQGWNTAALLAPVLPVVMLILPITYPYLICANTLYLHVHCGLFVLHSLAALHASLVLKFSILVSLARSTENISHPLQDCNKM